MLSWLRNNHHWSKHKISTNGWRFLFWKKSTSPWWHEEVYFVFNPKKGNSCYIQTSESCYWTHIKQIMKQENNLFSRTACNGMPIFFINSNRYFQYRLQLVISKYFHNYTVVTYDNIYTVSQSIYNISWVAIDECKNDPWARKPAQREENRYKNWDQQRIYASVVICWLMRWKVMILLYLEE